MRRSLCLAVASTPIWLAAVSGGCSVRTPGASDHTTNNADNPIGPDGGYRGELANGDPRSVVAGSDGTKRQTEVIGTCEIAQPPLTKLLVVPAGDFIQGCNTALDRDCRLDEKPARTVYLDTFEIDETEVTQAQYYACVFVGACRAPVCWDPCNRGNHPVGCVNHDDAAAYCAWVSKRLPTEAEWEKAARGTDGLLYPWGNTALACNRGNIAGCKEKNDTVPVGSYPDGASPYGVLDMVGNVVEFVADFYDADYYGSGPPDINPKGPESGTDFVGRGGSAWSLPTYQRASGRDNYENGYFKWGLGFRCAR